MFHDPHCNGCSFLQSEVQPFMQLLLLPPCWFGFAIVFVRVVVLVDARTGMRPNPVDVHPRPEHTSLSVQHPDGIVELLELLLLVSAF